MSLARAFTFRGNNKRPDISIPIRFASIRGRKTNNHAATTKRQLISGPLQLVSSTNMLTFDAPDIAQAQRDMAATALTLTTSTSTSTTSAASIAPALDSSAASTTSADRSSTYTANRSSADCTDSDMSLVSDASTVASADSPTSSPVADRDPRCYFSSPTLAAKDMAVAPPALDDTVDAQDFIHPVVALPTKSLKRSSSVQLPASSFAAAPLLPKRALSHSKREHERLARQRSVRLSGNASSFSRSSSGSAAAVILEEQPVAVLHPAATTAEHPFGHELSQLSEVAEDFAEMLDFSTAAADAAAVADAALMRAHGLCRFTADEYASEIAPCAVGVWPDEVVSRPGSGWF